MFGTRRLASIGTTAAKQARLKRLNFAKIGTYGSLLMLAHSTLF